MPAAHIVIHVAGQYNAVMHDESLELSDVLARLKRADESLAEVVAPLWPGVVLVASWIEGGPHLFRLAETAPEGYYLLKVAEDIATVLRPAEEAEVRKYLGYLTRASVILLENGMAYPASSIERLQGINGPRPIHFAMGTPLTQVHARFDGLNLYYDSTVSPRKQSDNPLEELFGGPSIVRGGELFGVPGEEEAEDNAARALTQLQENPHLDTEYRIASVLETAGAILEEWSSEDGGFRIRWRLVDEVHTRSIPYAAAPITSGICLPGSRGFDPATLIRLLHDHILDAWR